MKKKCGINLTDRIAGSEVPWELSPKNAGTLMICFLAHSTQEKGREGNRFREAAK